MTLAQDVQGHDLGEMVELFDVDLNPLGTSTIYRFCPSHSGSANVVYNSVTYVVIPIEASGFERAGQGSPPRPRLRISHITRYLHSAIVGNDDLLGAKVTRTVTFAKYLDGGSAASLVGEFPKDIYVVERKVTHNNVYVEWELTSAMDQAGTKLPVRQALQNICTHRYRTYSGSAFVYTDATCPYTDTDYFDRNGDVATAANDRCGKRVSDCKLRFGAFGELPGRFFPGINRGRY